MRILIDADGCPVVEIALSVSKKCGAEVILFCDTAHEFQRKGAQTVVVSKGADSADFALVNRLQEGDIAVTQDYGLAAMCLAKGGIPLNQDGMLYTQDNIDALLLARHTARKIRSAGGRLKGSRKRTAKQDLQFEQALLSLLQGSNGDVLFLKKG